MKDVYTDIVMINDNNLRLGGGERESQIIILNWASKKFNISVLQPGKKEECIPNVKFYHATEYERLKYLVKRPIAFGIYIFKIGRIIKNLNPKIVHSNSQVSFFILMLLRRLHVLSSNKDRSEI